MSVAIRHETEVRALLGGSARWRLVGLLFRRPRPGWTDEVEALARETGDAVGRPAITEGIYHALLGPGGPVSPREVSYRPLEDPGRMLAEIAAFHRAFAYRSSEEDPPDHVAAIADFVSYLALKEAYALGAGREPEAATAREARERFVERHAAPLARGLAIRLEPFDGVEGFDHLRAAARRFQELAGPCADGEATEPPGFLPPGLDEPVFDCGPEGECPFHVPDGGER